jgi:3-oxoacyl-[acyl-carrier-protein] synthase III
MGIKIIGTGSYAPERILTNHDLEKMVDTSDEWIRTRTGIEERHIAAENESASDMAYHACLKAMEMANTTPEEIDLILVATVSPDHPFPSTACVLQKKLNIPPTAMCFDMQAACSGFIYAIGIANAMIQAHACHKKALVIGVEKISLLTDWEDRNTCVLFGDGAGAVLLEERINDDDHGGILATKLASDGTYTDILQVPAGGSAMPLTKEVMDQRLQYITMEGKEVFKLAVTAMVNSCKEVLEEAGVDASEIRWLIPHQANMRIITAVGRRLNLTEKNVYINVNKYGNTSAASVGIALDELVRSGQVERGEYLLLTAFGSGLTWGATLLKW